MMGSGRVMSAWPCWTMPGGFHGVLVSAVNLEYFESLYSSLGFDGVSQILLLNQDGELLAGQPREQDSIGKRFANPETLATFAGRPEESAIEIRSGVGERKRYIAFSGGREISSFLSVPRSMKMKRWNRGEQLFDRLWPGSCRWCCSSC